MDESRIRQGLPVRLSAYHSQRLRKRFPDRHKGHKHVFGVIVSDAMDGYGVKVRTSGRVYCILYLDEVFEVSKHG